LDAEHYREPRPRARILIASPPRARTLAARRGAPVGAALADA
jgi:hypothetical protein